MLDRMARRCRSSAPTTTPATTAPAAARPATSSTPTTARRSTPARTPPYGNRGTSADRRPDHPEGRAGPPDPSTSSRNSIPSSQCIVCHIHPGTTVMNSYLGYMWWDNETDGELMYPAKEQQQPDAPRSSSRSSEPTPRARPRAGSGPTRSSSTTSRDLNPKLKHTQFADFHGHGWVFRAVYKQDRKGNLLDADEQGRGRRRIPERFNEGGPPQGHPPREGDALLGLPLQAGHPRQRQALRRDARGRRDRLRRLPRHDQASRRHAQDLAARPRRAGGTRPRRC